ncbi:MAG: Hcp family type VI secretion system effector [Opitutaceae bacterium]
MAQDIFIEIDGIKGESTDDKHKDWIEVLSYSTGVSQAISGTRSTGGAGSAGRCDHQDFTITKQLDKASPHLVLACCTGKHIAKIVISVCNASGAKNEMMNYTLKDVLISSISTGGGAGGESPTESVSLNYGEIEWTYTQLDHKTGAAGGKVVKKWSTTENTGG